VDWDVVESARAEFSGIDFIIDDVMAYEFRSKFDVEGTVAMVHHLASLLLALRRLADLTAPGGVLVVVGLARSTRSRDFAMDAVGVIQHRWLSWRRGLWEHSAPTVRPPPHSYAEVHQTAAAQLPGVTWRRLPMFRNALVWHKLG
jgi:SAM-dependent methyltransferase